MPILLNAGPSPHGWSRLGTMLQCPQRYAWTYILPESEGGGKQNKNSKPLLRGSLVHTALAHHYRRMQARQRGEDESQWYEPLDAMHLHAIQEGDAWLDEYEYCKKVVSAYITNWGTEKFKIIAVEETMHTTIGKTQITGRADLIVQDSNDKIWVVDHKTTSRMNSSQKNYYGISGQLIGYEYMGREIFKEFWGGMLLNQIQHRPPHKFNRVELPPAPNMLSRFPDMVKEAEDRMERFKHLPVDKYPMAMNELVCYHRYGACEFVEKCRWGKNI